MAYKTIYFAVYFCCIALDNCYAKLVRLPSVLSCCSAVSESDVGDQLVLLSSLAQLQNLDS